MVRAQAPERAERKAEQPAAPAAEAPAAPVSIFITVGTAHQPFDRLVQWVNEWAERSEIPGSVLFQIGTATTPSRVPSAPMLPYAEMVEAMRNATVVVCHGGTASASEARRMGHIPIVVPRLSGFGEAVDDHQVQFTRYLASRGLAHGAESKEELWAALDRALVEPSAFRAETSSEEPNETAERFGRLVETLATHPGAGPGIPVLYVGGMGRSGTTLLERMLGEVRGFHPVGEIVFLWERGLGEGTLCGCGRPFAECEFWGAVGEEAFGSWSAVDVDAVVALRHEVDRQRNIPLMLAPGLVPGYRRSLTELREMLAPLYRAVHSVSGARVVVDSSKHASYAFVVRGVPGVSLRTVHVVRDSRGVAYSLTKQVRRPDVVGEDRYMNTWPPAVTSLHWLAHNGGLDVLAATGTPSHVVRYESLVRRPREEMGRILQFAGRRPTEGDLGFIHDGSVELGAGHTVSGNPMRFTTGLVPLRPDEAWRSRMPARQRKLVTAMTAVGLARYGGHRER
jgi:UDP-N-acetylglucosamine transferase subunit ALG13